MFPSHPHPHPSCNSLGCFCTLSSSEGEFDSGGRKGEQPPGGAAGRRPGGAGLVPGWAGARRPRAGRAPVQAQAAHGRGLIGEHCCWLQKERSVPEIGPRSRGSGREEGEGKSDQTAFLTISKDGGSDKGTQDAAAAAVWARAVSC